MKKRSKAEPEQFVFGVECIPQWPRNNCDHKWGDPPDEYNKTRTIFRFDDEGQNFTLLRCDVCKRFLLKEQG